MSAAWKDVTGYSKSREPGEVEPRSWEMTVEGFRLVVTRHIDYGPEDWLIQCPIFKHVQTGISADDAKRIALEMVCTSLKRLAGGFIN